LLQVPPADVEEGEQQLELDLRLEVLETVPDLLEDVRIELGDDGAAGPRVIGGP
jgi:hypothetical protein